MTKSWGIVAVLAMAAGCGRFGFEGSDSTPSSGEVDVIVVSGGVPLQGRSVIFHDATGAVLDVVVTGPDGTAVGTVTSSGMVSVVFLETGEEVSARIDTMVDVTPGESLLFGSTYDPWAGAGAADITYGADVLGASYFEVSAGCGARETNSWDEVIAGYGVGVNCSSAGTASFIAGAYDDSDNLLAHSFVKNVAIAPQTTVPVAMPPWQTTMDSITVDVTNIPGADTFLEIQVQPTVGSVALKDFGTTLSANGSASAVIDIPAGAADGLGALAMAVSEYNGASAIYQKMAGAATSVAIDLADAPPAIDLAQMQPGATPDRPKVYLVGGSLSATTALYRVEWTSLASGTSTQVQWNILTSPSADAVLPALPDAFRNLRPAANDFLSNFSVKAAHLSATFAPDTESARTGYGLNIANAYYWPADDYRIDLSYGPNGPPGSF